MSSYKIQIYGTVSASIDVEADSYAEAVELAIENAPQTSFAGADFDGVDNWELADDYFKDGEYIEGGAQ